jgi:hypothetical protein
VIERKKVVDNAVGDLGGVAQEAEVTLLCYHCDFWRQTDASKMQTLTKDGLQPK